MEDVRDRRFRKWKSMCKTQGKEIRHSTKHTYFITRKKLKSVGFCLIEIKKKIFFESSACEYKNNHSGIDYKQLLKGDKIKQQRTKSSVAELRISFIFRNAGNVVIYLSNSQNDRQLLYSSPRLLIIPVTEFCCINKTKNQQKKTYDTTLPITGHNKENKNNKWT